MRFLSSVFEIVSLPYIRAGHGYDIGRDSAAGSGGDGGAGGIGTAWIFAGVVLTLVVIGIILVSLNPTVARAKLKSFGPKALILILIAAPLVVWTASNGNAAEKSLIVERWTNDAGAPELIVSLGEEELNTLETTSGKSVVRLECVDEGGDVLLAATTKWPFAFERGYEYPHMHQKASREQLLRADSCSLRGTRVRLEADVEGVLTG